MELLSNLPALPRCFKYTLAGLIALWLLALSTDRFLQAGISYKNLSHWQNPTPTNDIINLTGEGKVIAVPDVAIIDLAIEKRGPTVAQVQKDSTDKMNDIISYLKSSGIDSKDIQTTQYNLTPLYSYDPKTGKQDFNGYQLNQTVEVKIRQLDKASDILAAAITKGVNQVGQLTFKVDDPTALQAQARIKAVAQVKAKAESLAKAAGVKLGKVRSFSENVNNPAPQPMYYARKMDLGTAESNVATAPTMAAGSQEIVVNVTMGFEID